MTRTGHLLLLAVVCALARSIRGTEWSYEDVESWPLINPACGGQRQSPIDFPKTVTSFNPPQFVFHNYEFINTSLENNGHSLNVHIDKNRPLEQRPRVYGGGLPAEYILDAFHFHWGAVRQRGSEHLLNGCAFDAELHFVHVKKEYGTVGEALKHEDGLAVIGVWIIEENNTDPYGENDDDDDDDDFDFARVWLGALTPTSPTTQNSHTFVNLRQLLPTDKNTFYRYEGSLTTPPCTENVLWTVMANPIIAPAKFMRGLRALMAPKDDTHEDNTHGDSHGTSLNDNFRPTLPIGSRTVYYSGDLDERILTCTGKKDDDDVESDECSKFPPKITSGGHTLVEIEEAPSVYGGVGTGEGEQCALESPMDLYLRHTKVVSAPHLSWRPYGNCKSVSVIYDGHVLRARYPSHAPEWEMVGGNLPSGYYLSDIVFRWGSEHRLAGFSFPLELQFVHYNSKYRSVQEAMSKADGVIVVVKLFQEPVKVWGEVEYPNTGSTTGHNPELQSIIGAIPQIKQGGSGVTVQSPNVATLISRTSSYYEYQGNLPGAPCDTPVTWIVMRKVCEVSGEQLSALYTLHNPYNPRPGHYTSRTITLKVESPNLEEEFNNYLSKTKRESGEEPGPSHSTQLPPKMQVSRVWMYRNSATSANPSIILFISLLIITLGRSVLTYSWQKML